MGKTAHVTCVLVHGAGSTGAAAAALVGAPADAVLVEDRTGDVAEIVSSIEEVVGARDDCTSLIGVSLGAHAVALWASGTALPLPRITCVLPAWCGAPGGAAMATAASAREVEDHGIAGALERLTALDELGDILALLRMSWADYDDASLVRSLLQASGGDAPSALQLASIAAPVAVVGWYGDAFHPAAAAWQWAAHLREPVVAMGARPEARLLRQALVTASR